MGGIYRRGRLRRLGRLAGLARLTGMIGLAGMTGLRGLTGVPRLLTAVIVTGLAVITAGLIAGKAAGLPPLGQRPGLRIFLFLEDLLNIVADVRQLRNTFGSEHHA